VVREIEMRKRTSWGALGLLLISLVLGGCNSDGGLSDQDDGNGGGGGGGGTPVVKAASLRLLSSSVSLSSSADSASEGIELTAIAVDSNNLTLEGAIVNFTSTSGVLVPAGTTTGSDGTVTAILHTGGDPTPRTILVTASSGTLTQTLSIPVEIGRAHV
jgi:hypothetical protein